MRDLRELDRFRVMLPPIISELWDIGAFGNAVAGAFVLRSPIDGKTLRVLASNGDGWDHVSVSLVNRAPRWRETDILSAGRSRNAAARCGGRAYFGAPPLPPHLAASWHGDSAAAGRDGRVIERRSVNENPSATQWTMVHGA